MATSPITPDSFMAQNPLTPDDFMAPQKPKRWTVPGMEHLGGTPPGIAPVTPPGELESPASLKSRRIAANAPSFINPRTGERHFGDDHGTGPLAILDMPTEGVQEIGEGVSRMAEPGLREKASGAHKIIGGVFKAATPLMAGAGVVAPLATATTLGVGMGAQAGVEKGLKAAGVSEEYSALAGDVAGIAAGGLAGSKLHARGKTAPPEPAPIPDSVETIKLQVDQLASGQRKAVLVTPNAPEVPAAPPGFKTLDTKDGTLIYNPKLTNARTLKRASAFGKLNEVLGPTEGGMGPESKVDIQESGQSPVAVVAKAPDGTSTQETLATPDGAPEAAQQAEKVTPPDGEVTVESPEQTLARRAEIKPNVPAYEGERAGKIGIERLDMGKPGVSMEQRDIPGDRSRTIVYRDAGGSPQGYLRLYLDDNLKEVAPPEHGLYPEVYVTPAARRSGIASLLYDEAGKHGWDLSQVSGTETTPAGAAFLNSRGERGAISGDLATLGLGKVAQAARERGEAKKYGEQLRTNYTGERDVRVAETNQLRDALKKVIPETIDQEALSLMRDFKNKPGEMQQFLDGTHPSLSGLTPETRTAAIENIQKLRPVIERAVNPTPELKAADQVMTEYFDQHLEEGKTLGFLKSNISSDEYITHLLEPKGEEEAGKPFLGSATGKIGRTTPYAQRRFYPTILDAVADGVRPRTLNSLDALTIYGDKHATAAATHILINNLKGSDIGKWGTGNSKNMPKDWVPLAPESGRFQNEVPFLNSEGEADISYQNFMVPPKVADALRPITDPNYMSRVPFFMTARMYQAYVKSVELGMSGFHLKALNLSALGNEGITGLVESYRQDMDSPKFQEIERGAIKDGLTTSILGRTIEAYRAANKSSIPTLGEKLRDAPGLKQLSQAAEAISHLTFDVVQRKTKVTDFAIKDAKWMADHPQATPQEHTIARRSIATQVNAVYGGLQWENIGVNRMTLEIGKALLLAPDWTFSNLQNVKQAFQGGPAGDASRMFWFRSAITGVALTQGTSLLLSGKLSPDPTSVLIGQDDRGRNIFQNMFFAGAPGDFVNLVKNVADYGPIQGTAQSVASKLSPIARAWSQMLVNRDYQGQPIVPKGTGEGEAALRSVVHAGSQVLPVPFAVSGPAKMAMNKNQSYSPTEYLTSVLAGGHSRHVAPTKATALMDQYQQEDAPNVRHPKERNQIKNQITNLVRAGKEDEAIKVAKAAIAAGKITGDENDPRNDVYHAMQRALKSPLEADFDRLDFNRAFRVLAVANEQEKELIGPMLAEKLERRIDTLPRVEHDELVKLAGKIPELAAFAAEHAAHASQ